MNITEPFVLKDDVLLIPCAELSEEMRERVSFDEGDFTLSRRHGRGLAQVIDGETAALLKLFREPRTIVDAVLQNSRSAGRDPAVWLDELLPHLGKFLQNNILVPAGSAEEQEIRPRHEAGAKIGRWEVVRCASLIEDSEVHQLRDGTEVAALKIARSSSSAMQRLFDNETAILRRLEGAGIAPRLLEAGLHEERPYLIIDWLPGVDAGVAAAERRHDRASLIDLCASIAEAYAALHARGVLHADVHPRNVLVGDRVMLLDFGFSSLAGQPPRVGRGGMYYFFEPEYLAAQRHGVMLPPSAAGEQYALAALLYLLVSGHHYLDFRYEREEMARQVESDPPVPFAKRGIPPWPEVEQLLFRALEKDPSRRYGSMAEFAALLAAARDEAVRKSLAAPVSPRARALLEETLQSFARGGEMFITRYPLPPTASVNYGCAGAAAGLLRIAEARSDAALLALADVWRSRAATLIGREGSFYADAIDAPAALIGEVTPYHTESGIHAAAAMIAAAMADTTAQHRAIAAFLRASDRPCPQLDLTLGRSGSLLAAALLLDDAPDHPPLRAFGSATMAAIWAELDAHPSITGHLGMAHGWTGYLYAALRWCAASGSPLPARLVSRLHELAALEITKGRGVYWPIATDRPPSVMMPGWCSGSAGQVFLFTLAHRILGDPEWLHLAERCAWNTWDEPRGIADLCCGTAGRAYALLNLYKHTGATEWLSRARHLANHAAAHATTTAPRRNALWKGELGVATLIADLGSPENARMPFFE
ncbi:MAG TPA: lanthionine synthetase LanC family protein [Thermoanaerobaculia bacterium]|jgi:serine/threonine-protein kinase|nr:lanthionine synthetase LanC family protein [Thermoanaerobaculia bacterium]